MSWYILTRDVNFGAIKAKELVISNARHSVILGSFSKFNKEEFQQIIFLIKQVPPNCRTYDPNTRVWTVYDSVFDNLNTLLVHIGKNWPLIFFHLTDEEWNERVLRISPAQKEIPPPEEFFYNTAPATQSVTPAQIAEKLQSMLRLVDTNVQISALSDLELKKVYRKTAMQLHPDRNNGDGSRMSELNMLWQQYTAK